MAKAHHVECQDSPMVFLRDSWMESTSGYLAQKCESHDSSVNIFFKCRFASIGWCVQLVSFQTLVPFSSLLFFYQNMWNW